MPRIQIVSQGTDVGRVEEIVVRKSWIWTKNPILILRDEGFGEIDRIFEVAMCHFLWSGIQGGKKEGTGVEEGTCCSVEHTNSVAGSWAAAQSKGLWDVRWATHLAHLNSVYRRGQFPGHALK